MTITDVVSNSVQPDLTFSTKSYVFGMESTTDWESSLLDVNTKRKLLGFNNYKCAFCDFKASNNQIHNITDNHEDNRPENLTSVDPICHAWKHLGEIREGEGIITYLQNVLPQNFNHLQRTLFIALNSSDMELKKDAEKVLNWLGKRQEFVKDAFKTTNPNDFGKSITKLRAYEDKRNIIFKDLFLLLNPKKLTKYITVWISELKTPIKDWKRVYKDIDKMIG